MVDKARDNMIAQAVAALSGGPERLSKSSGDTQQIDSAGQAILSLLQQASSVTEANNQRAAAMVEKLSLQLRAAEDRIASLQSEAQFYRESSEQSEIWLRRIYDEIEHQFLRQLPQKQVGS